MNYRELSSEQRRQWLDYMQVDELLREKREELERRYSGSMRWLERGSKQYLHVKRGRTEKSLGERSEDTEKTFNAFMQGRSQVSELVKNLTIRADKMAPLNRALGLGRVPTITAQVLRQLEKAELLGSHLLVAGTNALWAYEAKAGLQFQSDVLATVDADILWDPRLSIDLLADEVKEFNLLSLLQKIDRTFQTRGKSDFRAFNKDGFSVDLIRPEDEQFFASKRDTISGQVDDLTGAPIFGLHWLLNAPRFSARTIAEDGYSVLVSTFDPRAFSLHKLWLSDLKTRDPVKAKRDIDQALVVSKVAQTFLNLEFDSTQIRALPKKLRDLLSRF